MPIYEYQCKICGRTLEKRQKFSDPELTVCPHCNGKLEKLISAPAVQFKGGGWYADLYSSSKGGNKPAASGESGSSNSNSGESGTSAGGSSGESSGSGKSSGSSSDSSSSSTAGSSSSSSSSPAVSTTPLK